MWTVLVVIVNQIAYTVVVRLASGGTAQSATDGCGVGLAADATGYTIYSTAFLIVMVPHSIVTVSLATASCPDCPGSRPTGTSKGWPTPWPTPCGWPWR